MGNFTIEQKAKAYDKALEIANDAYKDEDKHLKATLERIFPELKESEDERIKKAIISGMTALKEQGKETFAAIHINDCIAWLEKQGELANFLSKGLDNAHKRIDELIQKNNELCIKLEKQNEQKPYGQRKECSDCQFNYAGKCKGSCQMKRNEQKPTNKVEPKFKVGDFIVNDYCMGKVVELTNDAYLLDTEQGIPFSCEHNVHLWTIEDAKPGDVLVDRFSKDNIIILYEGINPKFSILAYCGWNGYNLSIKTNGLGYGNLDNTNYYPATKEQRDLLFQKMREAGYEWDVEKKKLKKIVVPIFNIGDTIIKKHNSDIHDFGSFTITDITGGKYWYNDRIICDITEQDDWEIYEPIKQNSSILSKKDEEYDGENYGIDGLWHAMNILEKTLGKVSGYQTDDGFLSHQCAITAVKKLYKQKTSEWSEEDKWMIQTICHAFEKGSSQYIWLKSLKDRVLPQPKQEWSEEDKVRIEQICDDLECGLENFRSRKNVKGLHFEEIIKSNIDWLKSLKDRYIWKPSKEQLKSLKEVIDVGHFTSYPNALETLYEQLKKLREE